MGATLHTTMRPCFGCLKEALQAGIIAVHYMTDWSAMDGDDREALDTQYASLRSRFQEFQRVEAPRAASTPLLASSLQEGGAS